VTVPASLISRASRRAQSQAGSAAVELVLATPLLVALMMLIVTAGRLVQARLEVTSAAMQAARAASLARDPATATASATAVASSALASQHLTCGTLAVSTNTAAFRPGGQVIVQVSCTVSLAGLALLRLPGAEALTSQAAAPIDFFRGALP
jgi:Flp pilus assembly protein TadG